MKSKAMIPLLLGGVVGLVAIKFGMDAVRSAQGTPAQVVQAVVARVDIPASYEITPDMVRVLETPKTPLVPEGAFGNVEALSGRVTSKAIPQGAVIAPMSLAPPGTPPGLTERIPEGYRAVSVKIDEVSGVAGQITPGDFVDVIVVLKVKRGRRDETISRIILQRVKVLAVGRSLGGPAEAGAGQRIGPTQVARSVTLLVTDTDVPKLHLAQTQGKIALAMRGADDRLLADSGGLASTLDWEDEPRQAPSQAGPMQLALAPPLAADQPGNIPFTKGAPAELAASPYTVTVFNDGVQRVTYENRNSMNVTDISVGRTGQGYAGSPDSTEGIVGKHRRPGQIGRLDRASQRTGQWTGGTEEPQDREIAGE